MQFKSRQNWTSGEKWSCYSVDVYAHLKPFIEILAFKVMLTCGGLHEQD